ncbi:MAG TPA: hypothetical protein VME42_15160 [Steroidobacteraceae bacterium]|nr:hypothetical protein [Steroidobacteraceae bacterium]
MTLLKGIVVCLALANIGYFLWSRGIAHPQDVGPAPAATLMLASEVPAGQSPGAAAAARAAAEAGSSGGGMVGASGGAGSSGGTSGPGAGSGVTASAGSSVREEAASEGSAGLLTNVKRCISVGPFRDVAEAAHAASTLRSGGYDPRQRVADGEVWAGIWVYLPIPASRSSEQMLAKLKSGGVEDALEMPGPNEGSVISLGLFGDSKRAQTRVAQAQSLGFNPAIADRKRTGDVYWIDIDLKPTDSVLKPSDLQGEAGRIQRLEVKACPVPGGAAS